MLLPEPNTFFYHYKRKPELGIEESAYVVIGIAIDTDDRANSLVIYKPLYFCNPRQTDEGGKSFFARRLIEFNENVEKDGITMLRFTPISDQNIIDQLKKHELYTSKYLDE